MKRKLLPTRIFLSLLFLAALLSASLAEASPASAAPAASAPGANRAEESAATSCAFGYAFQSQPLSWLEIKSTGTPLAFSLGDDSTVQVSGLPFSFPFFENAYNQVLVSTNGFLLFGTSSSNAYPGNRAIPSEILPNNLVAGFWDDLTVGGTYNSGAVYYQVLGAYPSRVAVFEWYQVTRLGSTSALSFEILLAENGTITFNYAELNGTLDSSTVGLEDADGIDGCQMVYNTAGLASNSSYDLTYPPAGPRVKMGPVYQGQFLVKGVTDLPVTLTNTGTVNDSYQFNYAALAGANDWQVQMLNSAKGVMTNTPVLTPGQHYSAWIRVTSAPSAGIGVYLRGQVTAVSNTNPVKTFTVSFDAAVPAPFAAFYIDSGTAYLRYSMPERQITSTVFTNFSGSTFSLARIASHTYMAAWEYIRRGADLNYENIQKTIAGPTQVTGTLSDLLDNSTQEYSTLDANPAMTVTPNGVAGIAFVRAIRDDLLNQNANVYFARLDTGANLLPPALNLTQNYSYYRNLIYSHPTISPASTDRFLIAYEALTLSGDVALARDIDLTVVNSSGAVLKTPSHLTDSQASGTSYYNPALTRMSNGDVLVVFQAQASGATLSQLKYTIYHPGSGTLDPISALDGAFGQTPHLATLFNGSMLLAWIEEGSLNVGYMIFNAQGAPALPAPQHLAALTSGKMENLSLSGEVNGRAILTWKDEWSSFLFYALVGADGSLVTPPMAFLRGSNPSAPSLINSSTGMGIAALPNEVYWYNFTPVIRR